jgi:hypothetical protein
MATLPAIADAEIGLILSAASSIPLGHGKPSHIEGRHAPTMGSANASRRWLSRAAGDLEAIIAAAGVVALSRHGLREMGGRVRRSGRTARFDSAAVTPRFER